MPHWLRVALVVVIAWAALSVVFGLLRLAAAMAGALALPIAVLLGFLYWRRQR